MPPIGDSTPVTLALVIAALGGVWTVAGLLWKMRSDIRHLSDVLDSHTVAQTDFQARIDRALEDHEKRIRRVETLTARMDRPKRDAQEHGGTHAAFGS